jgi:hypothetical protein
MRDQVVSQLVTWIEEYSLDDDDSAEEFLLERCPDATPEERRAAAALHAEWKVAYLDGARH